jgi:hypothetical protein
MTKRELLFGVIAGLLIIAALELVAPGFPR